MEAIDLFSQKTDEAIARNTPRGDKSSAPTEDLLLQVDRSYRQQSARNALPKVAPKLLNRSGIAWLPVMHIKHGKWHFTARFSNTLRAHQMGKTSDWVIVSYRSDDDFFGKVTIVTQKNQQGLSTRKVRGLVKQPE